MNWLVVGHLREWWVMAKNGQVPVDGELIASGWSFIMADLYSMATLMV